VAVADGTGQGEPEQTRSDQGLPSPSGDLDPASAWSTLPAAAAVPVAPTDRGPRIAAVAAGVAAVLALVLGVGWYFGRPASGDPAAAPQPGTASGQAVPSTGWPSAEGISCEPLGAQQAASQPDADRVSAGGLSYPMPPAPWPQPEVSGYPMPLMFSEAVQLVRVADYGTDGWAAGLLVMGLRDDLGLQSVEQAARVAAGCMLATQYVEQMSQRQTRNEATTVDGHDAWTIESAITLNDPDLSVSAETMSLTAVETEPGHYGLFWSSIPDVDPDYTAVAEACREGLHVD
jgi:hypothetical protein